MGVEIQMVSTAYAVNGRRKRSSLRLSAEAAARCLIEANKPFNSVQHLVNAGLYRDKNIGEPAIATLIHTETNKQLPAELRYNHTDSEKLLAFDAPNGGVGLLNGIQILTGIMTNDKPGMGMGMVIAGDAPPTRKDQWNFPYSSAAAAILLSHSQTDSGFLHFTSQSFPEAVQLYSGMLKWKRPIARKNNRNRIEINTSPDYLPKIISSVIKTLPVFYDETNLSPNDIDLIIPSVCPAGLSTALNDLEGFKGKVILPDNNFGLIHTAGLGFSLKKVWYSRQYDRAKNILFIAVGAGITISLGWYHQKPRI